MKDLILKSVSHSSTLDEVCENLIQAFKKAKSHDGNIRIGYVAGMITSEGPDKIPENLKRLESFADKLREKIRPYLFASTDVFGSTALWKKLEKRHYTEPDWIIFWRKLLSSGTIDEIYLTPRWEKSRGAMDEYITARQNKISLFTVDEDFCISAKE